MNLIPIKVVCHSGFKADEYPMCFYWENIRFEIIEITDRWYQANATPQAQRADYFKVCTKAGSSFILKHELSNDQWFVVSPGKTVIPFTAN